MKNVLLIGLGRFGRHMAQKLRDLNHQVLAIDKDERRVQDAMAYVTNAEIGDAADPALIDALGDWWDAVTGEADASATIVTATSG